jgi:hypothetical protein
MARIVWKEDDLISIETRTGIYVLAQMLYEPYLFIYEEFGDEAVWKDIDLSTVPMLFCHAVTRQFLKNSNVTKQTFKGIKHDNLPNRWISQNSEARKIRLWEGTPDEKEIIDLGEGGMLIEKDIFQKGFQQTKDQIVVIPQISLNDQETIEKYELTNLGVYPEFNERLYLCYQLKKNVDPLKDLAFNRPIPLAYKRYIEIISS